MTKVIAYLAPEIPSLSTTFIYSEIFAVEERGIRVIPISVRYPDVLAQQGSVEQLLERTEFLYTQPFFSILGKNIAVFLTQPIAYLRAFFTALGDTWRSQHLGTSAWKLIYHFCYASQVVRILKKNACQHLHIHFAHVPTQIGMYASLISGIPFTFTSHANDLFERGLLLTEKVERAKGAVVISEYNRNFLIEKGVDAQKLILIRCGIDVSKHRFIERQESKQVPKIGSLARLVEKKGMDVLILALKHLHKDKGVDFCLEIGGDGVLMGSLRSLVSECGLDSKVFFKGSMPHIQVFPWLQSLDLFVLACKQDVSGDRDGIPVVLMEAMSVGTPVISTRISGISELICDGVSGLLAEPGDPVSLADAIYKIIKSSHSVSSMTTAAREVIFEEFDRSKNIDKLMNLFCQKFV